MILGWDIGGVNTKVARLDDDGRLTVRSRPFELQRRPDALVDLLCELAAETGVSPESAFACVVTMTAELSQMFRTKRDGVHFVLDAVSAAFRAADIRVFTTDGRFLVMDAARAQPMAVAAANWAATARLVAARYNTALLIDVGTTTTDIIPIVAGDVVARGATDPERLASGELVYTGALRTPIEAIVHEVPYRGSRAGVSAEGFALIGDVHVWRGCLAPEDYSVPAPDGRDVARACVGERIARVICADRELVDESEITHIADFVAAEQRTSIANAITCVRSRHPDISTAVVMGLGEFIARDAARAAGLDIVSLGGDIGADASRYAPAAAVALLARDDGRGASRVSLANADPTVPARQSFVSSKSRIDLVIKVGGGLLDHRAHLERVLTGVAEVARAHRVVVVPGGGPFADAVRRVDDRLGLGDDEAHWMAVLAMDQYAQLLAARIPHAVIASSREEVQAAHARQQVPVLAPMTWVRRVDPLPHTWNVTSDSIAAWLAGELGAERLLLVKPPGARGGVLVDGYFENALPKTVGHACLEADAAIELMDQMAGTGSATFEAM